MQRLVLLLLLAASSALAQEDKDTQIDWIGDWDQALKVAKQTERPIMFCVNSIDGERANERAAKEIYKDKEFVALTRKFVMVVASTREHGGMFGHCKRFGRVTCKQHRDCEKRVRNTYADHLPQKNGEMISPQHAFFDMDGRFLRRREFELGKPELMKMMRAVLKSAAGRPADDPAEAAGEPADQPLSAADKDELQKIETARNDEDRHAAVTALVGTGKKAAISALLDLLVTTKKAPVKCAVMRGLGKAGALGAREAIELQLGDKNELVRNFAAVALEELAQEASVPALLKRLKRERERYTRKNLCRALGACGGPYANKDAAKALLTTISKDKQIMVRKHAAIACKDFANDKGKPLVRKRLESLALREKAREVRGGIVYALAFVGETKTTLPVFEKLLEDARDDLARGWLRNAIRVLKKRGTFDGRGTWWLFGDDRRDPARSDGRNDDWPGRGGGGR